MRGYIQSKKAMIGRTGINGYLCTSQGVGSLTTQSPNTLVDFTLEARGTISTPTYNLLYTPINSSYTYRGITFETYENNKVRISGTLEDYKNGDYGTEVPMSFAYFGGTKWTIARQYLELAAGTYYWWIKMWDSRYVYDVLKQQGITVFVQKYNTTTNKWESYKNFSPYSISDPGWNVYKYTIPDDGNRYCVDMRVEVKAKDMVFGRKHDFAVQAMLLKGEGWYVGDLYIDLNLPYKPCGHETTITSPTGTLYPLYSKYPISYGSKINYKAQAAIYASGDVEKIIFPEFPLEDGTYTIHPRAYMCMHYFSDTEPILGG